MNNIKIAFFDIDGTLIDIETKIMTETMIETLQRLKSNGIKICIATGRTSVTLPKFEGIEFDAYLTFNGSYCFNKNETIHSNPFSTSDVNLIIDNAKAINRPVSIASTKRLAANGVDEDLKDYYAIAKLKLEISDDFEEVAKEDVYQIMMGARENEYSHILEGTSNVKISAWWDRAVDVIPANSGKGAGIRKILEYYHLSKEDAIAFGDGNNDIEMF